MNSDEILATLNRSNLDSSDITRIVAYVSKLEQQQKEVLVVADKLATVSKQYANQHKGVGPASVFKAVDTYQEARSPITAIVIGPGLMSTEEWEAEYSNK